LREGFGTRRWLAVEKWSPCWWRTPWASPEWLRNRLHEQQSVGSRASNHLPVPPPPPQWTGPPSRASNGRSSRRSSPQLLLSCPKLETRCWSPLSTDVHSVPMSSGLCGTAAVDVPARRHGDSDPRNEAAGDQARVVASSCHVSPRAASRSLMWPSARFRRSANVLGLSSVDSKNH
jgi:hypothetical protein